MLITQMLVSSSKYSRKCPYAMTPEGITIHNTANDASAKNEISYMIGNNNQTSFHYAVDDYQAVQGIPENRNSWNAGDGHGFGNMKTISIEICYSKSGGDRFHKAEENAAELTAILMKKYGWGTDKIGTKTINTHQYRSGKYCPHRTLDEGIDRFWNMVREKYATITGTEYNPQPETPSTSGRKVGDVVTINGIYTSSTSTTKLNPARNSGTITKIVSARNPYLLDYGNLGWTNDSCIVGGSSSSAPSTSGKSLDQVAQEVINGQWGNGSDRKSRLQAAGYNYSEVQNRVNEILTGKSSSSSSSSSSKSIDTLADEVIAGKWGSGADRKNRLQAAGYDYNAVQARVNEKLGVKSSGGSSSSSSSSSIKVGDRVKVKSGAKDYNGTKLSSAVYSNTYDVIQVNGNRVVIGKGSAVTAAVNKSNLYKV